MKEEVMFLLRGRIRAIVLEKLEEPLTPLIVSKLLKKPLPSVSRVIKELWELKLIECLNPEKDRWRRYQITKLGKDTLKAYNHLNS